VPGRDAAANRELWTRVNAEYAEEHAFRAWAAGEITWGIFNVPEIQLGVLGDVSGLDVVELGCGTAYLSAWLARRGARPVGVDAQRRDTGPMVDDTARDRAIYHALKAADEVAAALQTHLIEEHGADPERAAPQSPATNSLKLLRQARERLGVGLRAVQADHIAESDEISLRNR
jgi:SAM-dependent methyltransferase